MIDRLLSYVLFLGSLVVLFTTAGMGTFALYILTLKYDWMVEHEMLKHSYVTAALAIVAELILIFLLRRLVIFAYEAFIIAFPRKPHDSV